MANKVHFCRGKCREAQKFILRFLSPESTLFNWDHLYGYVNDTALISIIIKSVSILFCNNVSAKWVVAWLGHLLAVITSLPLCHPTEHKIKKNHSDPHFGPDLFSGTANLSNKWPWLCLHLPTFSPKFFSRCIWFLCCSGSRKTYRGGRNYL